MYLNLLTLTNWGIHESLDIRFSRGLQIEGRNGVGKSTVLDALRYIFSSSARGWGKNIRNGCRAGTVKLEFTFDGKDYSIEKTIFLDKQSQALMICDGVQLADNTTSVYERLQQIMPEDVFEKLVYIPQGGLTSILDKLSGKDGKNEMDRLFGLDRLEKVWLGTGEKIKNVKIRSEIIRENLSVYPNDFLKICKKNIEIYTFEKNAILDGEKVLLAKINDLKKALTERETNLSSLNKIKKQNEKLISDRNNLNIKKTELKSQIKMLEERLIRHGELSDGLIGLKAQVKSLENIQNIRGELLTYLQIGGELEKLKDSRGLKEELEGLNIKLSGFSELNAENKVLVEKVERLKRELTLSEGDWESAKKQYIELSDLEGVPKCPRCHQKLNAYNLEKEIRESAFNLAELDVRKKSLKNNVETFNNLLSESKHNLDNVLKCKDRAEMIIGELKDRDVKISGFLVSLEESQAKLKKWGYDGCGKENVEEDYTKFNILNGKIYAVEEEIRGFKDIEKRIDNLKTELSGYDVRFAQTCDEIEKLNFDEGEMRSFESERESLSIEVVRCESELKNIKLQVEGLDSKINELQHDLDKFEGESKNYKNLLEEMNYLKKARDIFHRDKGLAKYLRQQYIEGLNRLLTENFKRVNQNPKYVDVSFDDEYNLVFRSNEGKLNQNQISGGERVQLALALRIALSELISPIPLLIIDEPFGSLDEDHRELLGSALNKIGRIGQLITVTHVQVQSLQLESRLDLGGY